MWHKSNFLCQHINSIYECVALLCYGQFLLGCTGFTKVGNDFVLNHWTRLYSYIYALCIYLGLIYSLYSQLASILIQLDGLLLSICLLELCMSSVMFIGTTMSMQFNAMSHLQLYSKLEKLDLRLRRNFHCKPSYKQVTCWNFMVEVLFVVSNVVIVTCITLQLYAYYADVMQFLCIFMGVCCYCLMLASCQFNGYAFMTMADLLSQRFELLHKELANLKKSPTANWLKLKEAIFIMQDLHLLIPQVNCIYKWSLLTALAHDFTLSTSELYLIFSAAVGSKIISPNTMVYIVVFMLPMLSKMFIMPLRATASIAKGQNCLKLIDQMDFKFPQHSQQVQQLVSSISYWRLQHKFEFSCGWNIGLHGGTITFVS